MRIRQKCTLQFLKQPKSQTGLTYSLKNLQCDKVVVITTI